MARLSDLHPNQQATLEALDCPKFDEATLVPKRPLDQCRVALISSAGLMQRNDENVSGNDADYRSFGRACPDRDILINHISVNFDRTAYAEDVNTVFPRAILGSMEEDGTIEHAARVHYSFMGATTPERLQASAEHLAMELKAAKINTVCLLPV